jgi:hypothetical protein
VPTPMTATTTPSAVSLAHWAKRLAVVAVARILAMLGFDVGTSAALPAPATPYAAVHVLAARASTGAPGAGIIGSLVTLVQNSAASTVITSSVNYPALLFPYNTSTDQGDAAVRQGAQLVGDVLGGVVGLGAAGAPVGATGLFHGWSASHCSRSRTSSSRAAIPEIRSAPAARTLLRTWLIGPSTTRPRVCSW